LATAYRRDVLGGLVHAVVVVRAEVRDAGILRVYGGPAVGALKRAAGSYGVEAGWVVRAAGYRTDEITLGAATGPGIAAAMAGLGTPGY
jgi:hypothetical protein